METSSNFYIIPESGYLRFDFINPGVSAAYPLSGLLIEQGITNGRSIHVQVVTLWEEVLNA